MLFKKGLTVVTKKSGLLCQRKPLLKIIGVLLKLINLKLHQIFFQ